MKNLVVLLLLCVVAPWTWADQRGFYVGGIFANASNVDCDECRSVNMAGVDLGVDFTSVVGLNGRLVLEDEVAQVYFGADLGHDFNTRLFRLYGKVGLMYLREDLAPGDGYVSDTSLALGIGVRFTPMGNQDGLYIRLEALAAEFYDEGIGTASVAVGYKF